MEQENNKGLKIITVLGILAAVATVIAVFKMSSEDKPSLSGLKGNKVKKIGSNFFVVYEYGKLKHADENGNMHRADEIMSRPYKTEKGAEKQLTKVNKQAGINTVNRKLK